MRRPGAFRAGALAMCGFAYDALFPAGAVHEHDDDAFGLLVRPAVEGAVNHRERLLVPVELPIHASGLRLVPGGKCTVRHHINEPREIAEPFLCIHFVHDIARLDGCRGLRCCNEQENGQGGSCTLHLPFPARFGSIETVPFRLVARLLILFLI